MRAYISFPISPQLQALQKRVFGDFFVGGHVQFEYSFSLRNLEALLPLLAQLHIRPKRSLGRVNTICGALQTFDE